MKFETSSDNPAYRPNLPSPSQLSPFIEWITSNYCVGILRKRVAVHVLSFLAKFLDKF